jgi:DNA processing protein
MSMVESTLALNRPISPWLEMGAYEALWSEMGTWFKSLATKFREHPGSVPSDFVPDKSLAYSFSERAMALLRSGGVNRFGVRIHGAGDYPLQLRVADHPVEVLYYQGWWDLIGSRCIAVVGTRKPSGAAIAKAEELVRFLAKEGFTIVSGLATGIDTVAHETAIRVNAPTIAVIGTPLSGSYPRDNTALQRKIAKDHLLISQVPVCRYTDQNFRLNSRFFPERNITMSALTEATVIVEAGDTSGTLIQARAALKQGRRLFIMDNCFNVQGLKWPHSYLDRGAIRVKDFDEITSSLGLSSNSGETPADRCSPA